MIVAEPPPRRPTSPDVLFTVEEFVRMVEADVFGTTRVELLNGRVHWMSQNDPHLVAVSKGAEAIFRQKLPTDWLVIGGTLRLDRLGIDLRSAPDPDLMWFDSPLGTPIEVRRLPMLLIEISHTTYAYDVGEKLRKYAQAGIPDYWIEHLDADRVEVYRDPVNDTGQPDGWRYATVAHHGRGERVALLRRPEVSLAVDDLLP